MDVLSKTPSSSSMSAGCVFYCDQVICWCILLPHIQITYNICGALGPSFVLFLRASICIVTPCFYSHFSDGFNYLRSKHQRRCNNRENKIINMWTIHILLLIFTRSSAFRLTCCFFRLCLVNSPLVSGRHLGRSSNVDRWRMRRSGWRWPEL